MLTLLVPALINFLIDPECTKCDTNKLKPLVKLHEFSLQYLLKIGPVYPQVRILLYTGIYVNMCIIFTIVLGIQDNNVSK